MRGEPISARRQFAQCVLVIRREREGYGFLDVGRLLDRNGKYLARRKGSKDDTSKLTAPFLDATGWDEALGQLVEGVDDLLGAVVAGAVMEGAHHPGIHVVGAEQVLGAGADLGGMAAALNLIIPIPVGWIVAGVTLALLALQLASGLTVGRPLGLLLRRR